MVLSVRSFFGTTIPAPPNFFSPFVSVCHLLHPRDEAALAHVDLPGHAPVFVVELVHVETFDGDFSDGISTAEQKAPEPGDLGWAEGSENSWVPSGND